MECGAASASGIGCDRPVLLAALLVNLREMIADFTVSAVKRQRRGCSVSHFEIAFLQVHPAERVPAGGKAGDLFATGSA